tara:strand:+ start:444 stop:623 length:180 start_codon:yes stop_codon:yes gene_type:complete
MLEVVEEFGDQVVKVGLVVQVVVEQVLLVELQQQELLTLEVAVVVKMITVDHQEQVALV